MGYRYDDDILPEEQDIAGNFIVRHWRGGYSLAKSWFLIGGLLSALAINLLAGGVLAVQASASSLRIIAAAWLGFFAIFLLVRTWAGVGIWRSAGRHEDRGGNLAWAWLARILLGLGIILSLVQARTYGLIALDYGRIAAGHDALGVPATIKPSKDGTTLELSGVLAAGTLDRFRDAAARMPALRTVILDSPGGRIFEAQHVADYVRSRRLDTSVPSSCQSACTLILLAGGTRTADRAANIGFHQPDFPGATPALRRDAIAENRQDYLSAGIAPAFVDRMMQTPPDSMWFPPHQLLVEQGVLNGEEVTVGRKSLMEQQLAATAAELNLGLPRKLDGATTLVRVAADNRDLVMVNRLSIDLPAGQKARIRAAVEADNRRLACANEGPRRLIEDGGAMRYEYLSRGGKPLFAVRIADCG